MKNNNFNDLNEKELIEILEKGNLNEEGLDKLVEAMQAKGLSGSIMQVDPNDPETKDAVDYINYHKELPKNYQSKYQIEKAKKTLLAKKKTNLDKLKKAIMILAHSGELEGLETLQKYAKNPHPKLIVWVATAIQECRMFLESDLLDRPMLEITKLKKK